MKELFNNKNFKLLFAGNFVSEMGNVIFGFVAGLYVTDLTGDPVMLALFLALGAAVRLVFSPVAGVLVDRWNKVRIIYMTDFIRGFIFLAVGYIFFMGVDTNTAITILLIVTALSGFISAFFGPAVSAATPEIVGLAKVQQANGANSIIQSSTMIMGVVLGIVALGFFDFYIAVLINGASFVISGLSEMFIKSEFKAEVPNHEPPHMIEDMKIGFGYIKKKEGLLRMMTYSLFLNFAFTPLFSVGIPFLFRGQLERSEVEIGIINIFFGIAMAASGMIVGTMVMKSMTSMIRKSLLGLSTSFILIAINIYAFDGGYLSYTVFYILTIVLHISLAGFMMATNVPLNTGMVKVIDPKVRGKVFSTIGAISGGAVPIAIFLGGPIIKASSVAFLGVICSALLLVPTFGFLFDRKVKTLLEGIEEDSKVVDKELEDEQQVIFDELAQQS